MIYLPIIRSNGSLKVGDPTWKGPMTGGHQEGGEGNKNHLHRRSDCPTQEKVDI